MAKKDEAPRKRMVVEEVGQTETNVPQEPVEELKEKVGELQTITEGISQSAEKSSEVQEEIVEAAEKVVPAPTVVPNPVEPPKYQPSSGPSPMAIILPGILLLGALLGGILFYQKNISTDSVNNVETKSTESMGAVETPTASATPTAVLDLTKFKISVLNGGGVPGEAGKAKTLLETAGFTVASTANAKDYSFTKTIIGAKSTVDKAFLEALSAALSKTYVVGTLEELPASSTDSVVVTIGSSKK